MYELLEEFKVPNNSRRVAQALLSGGEFGRPLMVTPGTPPERVKILRESFAKALKDEELLAEAKKGRMDVDYSSGEELETLVKEVLDQPREVIEQAGRVLLEIHSRNVFPEMKIAWGTYPNNIGHTESPGCFRCHDGKHRSDDGAILSRDCSLCHLLIERIGEAEAGGRDSARFQVMKNPHPVDIGDSWKEMLCSECHGASP